MPDENNDITWFKSLHTGRAHVFLPTSLNALCGKVSRGGSLEGVWSPRQAGDLTCKNCERLTLSERKTQSEDEDDHRCHARGCTARTPPEKLLCPKHWRMVPAIIQRDVYAHYRPGQCDDKQPSVEWHRAADAAIGHVAVQEKRVFTLAERDAMVHFGLFRMDAP